MGAGDSGSFLLSNISVHQDVRASAREYAFFMGVQVKSDNDSRGNRDRGSTRGMKERERRGSGRWSSEAETETVSSAPATVGV